MTRSPTATSSGDGRILLLSDDCFTATVAIDASPGAMEAANRAAATCFREVSQALQAEDSPLRMLAGPSQTDLVGAVARRMWRAVRPFAGRHPIAPIAARDGALSEELLGAVTGSAALDRAVVVVGGCVALHLTPGFGFRTTIAEAVADDGAPAAVEVRSVHMIRGVGVAGGPDARPSLGIGEAVTVLAQTAAKAAAAAAVIADAIDLPGHPSITRVPANLLDPASPFAARPIVRNVGRLSDTDVAAALDAGRVKAERLLAEGLVAGAVLVLRGATVTVGPLETTSLGDKTDARRMGGGRA